MVACEFHNLKVGGSIPSYATRILKIKPLWSIRTKYFVDNQLITKKNKKKGKKVV